MKTVEKAVETFKAGRNCAQAIIGTFGPEHGMSEEECLRISSGFGGGMRRGEVCGAVSGSIMIIGLDFNPSDTTGKSKEAINSKVVDFTNRFEEKCGSIKCRDLLGCDISTPEGQLAASAKNTSETVCPGLVKSAAEILEALD